MARAEWRPRIGLAAALANRQAEAMIYRAAIPRLSPDA